MELLCDACDNSCSPLSTTIYFPFSFSFSDLFTDVTASFAFISLLVIGANQNSRETQCEIPETKDICMERRVTSLLYLYKQISKLY